MEGSAGKNRATQLFVAGCCFILVICAIQVWRAQNLAEFPACRDELSHFQQDAADGQSTLPDHRPVALDLAALSTAALEINATPTPVPTHSLSLAAVTGGASTTPPTSTTPPVTRDVPKPDLAAADADTDDSQSFDRGRSALAIQDGMDPPVTTTAKMEPPPPVVPQVNRSQPDIEDLVDASRSSRSWTSDFRPGLERNPQQQREQRLLNDMIEDNDRQIDPLDMNDSSAGRSPHQRPIYEPSISSDAKLLPQPPAPIAPKREETKTSRAVNDDTRSPEPRQSWPRATALIQQLAELPPVEGVGQWAEQVTAGLARVEHLRSINDPSALDHFESLYALVQQSEPISAHLPRSQQVAMRQAAYALNRRLDVWIVAHLSMQEQELLPVEVYRSVQTELLAPRVKAIRQSLADTQSSEASAWEQYLLLDELERSARGQGEFIGPARVELAQIVLDRLTDPGLTPEQVDVLQSVGAEALGQELLLWATRPVSQHQLLTALERFEQYPNAVTSRDLARYWKDLHWSTVPAQKDIAIALDQHYRNANVRISVNETMLNRLVPAVRDMRHPVRDRVLGAQVQGHSRSQAQLLVRMLPDRSRLRLMFETRGVSASRTTATKGPVTLLNRNKSNFRVRKVVLVDRDSTQFGQSQAIASGHSNLLGLRTNYDNLPIIGPMVRRIARKQHSQQAGLARKIFVNRVEEEARQEFDRRIESELARARAQLEEKLLTPMRRLELNPRIIETQTYQGRIAVRGRLAADHQLAAFTARPQAYLGSLLTMQVHESTLNNFLEQLQLDGRQADLKDLYNELTRKLQIDNPTEPEDIPDNVTIRFANRGAVRVSIDDDVVRLTLRIKYLKIKDDRSFKNFVVTADYRPFRNEKGGPEFYFSRDRGISISKRNIALRAIFTKVLSQNRKIYLINPELASDHRFAHLNVTQMEINNGWIGLSIGEGKASPSVALRPSQEQTR